MSKARLTLFGFHKANASLGRRHQARHMVWEPTRMFSDPSVAADHLTDTHTSLLRFATDVRAWCQDNNIPLKLTLPGIGAALLRDQRFWPNARGSVPRFINEQVRPSLPGVFQQRVAPTRRTIPTAVALDQRRAYHRAAQQVPTPEPTTLFARGHYATPDTAPIWAKADGVLYNRTIGQPGLVAVRATCRPARAGEVRLPALDRLGAHTATIYLWTNELALAIAQGLKVEGLTAAWTSLEPDTGLPRYGAWAEHEIDHADTYRRFWLKPTLHATYGLLGARARILISASKRGRGDPTMYLLQGVPFPVMERRTQSPRAPITTNVAMLGVLQAEIRRRTITMAEHLAGHGAEVLHLHADGLHIAAGQMPFIDADWSAEPITGLVYEDDVSWLSDQRDVLPGRDTRVRVELRRNLANRIIDQHRSGAHGDRRRMAPHLLIAAIHDR